MKSLYIAEKPSVAQEFAKALNVNASRKDGYLESEEAVITWCVGHLVTMSYPDAYDAALKRWTMEPLPFMPKQYKYEVIPSVKKQFHTVSSLLTREDVETIYVCTDSGREGEYIYRLVDQMAGVKDKKKKRVWIDSQTEEEILRGIREAKDLSCYDALSDAAYMRAIEDYMMGINFSRVLTLKYGFTISNFMNQKKSSVIAIGRVMTCVLGMIVKREREIRQFVKQPFYKIQAVSTLEQEQLQCEWKAVEGSKYYMSPALYKDIGFKKEEDAKIFVEEIMSNPPVEGTIESVQRKKEQKKPPLLFNLAELQNECSKLFKISPDETLKIVQELYEKKLVTYPRTDARVLSSAVAKEIHKNIMGIGKFAMFSPFCNRIMEEQTYKNIAKTQYVNDKLITDHYAIIPTGQGHGALKGLSELRQKVYEIICRRFIAIFYPPAWYQKVALCVDIKNEKFYSNFKTLISPGYLEVMTNSFAKAQKEETQSGLPEAVKNLKKGQKLNIEDCQIKKGETTPPKRYNSGSLILAMENAGQLIEDEDLRAQIKGSGIGTSATRAEIIKKLQNNKYIALSKKTQIVTPTQMGEMIFDVVASSIGSLLNPELTASWEKGLSYVAEGKITKEEYLQKLEKFVLSKTNFVKEHNNQRYLAQAFAYSSQYYKKETKAGKKVVKEERKDT